MIRNYNGNVNPEVLQDLQKLCDINAKDRENLLKVFAKERVVYVYENIDPITGCSDELNATVALRSRKKLRKYLKKDLLRRIDGYLSYKYFDEDYLISAVVEFIKKNYRYPKNDEMRKLETEAEAKRVCNQPLDTAIATKEITEQDFIKEILELSEGIMKTRRETKPADISVQKEPYDDELTVSDDNFSLLIKWNRYESRGNCTDYKCIVTLFNSEDIDKILFQHDYSGGAFMHAVGWQVSGKIISKNTLLSIHKFVVKMARIEGFNFTSEIDYENF